MPNSNRVGGDVNAGNHATHADIVQQTTNPILLLETTDRYSKPLQDPIVEYLALRFWYRFGGELRYARKRVMHGHNYGISAAELQEILGFRHHSLFRH